MDVAKGKIGSEGEFSVKFEGGKAIMSISHNHASGKASIVIEQDAKYFLDQLAKAIPGNVDDMIINMFKAALP